MKHFRVWFRLASMSLAIQTGHPLSSTGYLLGKILRLSFFLLFLSAIFKHTQSIAGYTLPEAALFFLTFNIIDILAQLLFRGIYSIRGLIREGDFDYFLIQPLNVLYRVSFNTVDFLDFVTVMPVLVVTFWVMRRIPGAFTVEHLLAYAGLCVNGLLIALAIHIAVAALAVWTQEMENTIWIYRDLMTLGRFPVDIYDSWMRSVLTFLIPIAVMTSFPAKAFLGILDGKWVAAAALMSLVSMSLVWPFGASRHAAILPSLPENIAPSYTFITLYRREKRLTVFVDRDRLGAENRHTLGRPDTRKPVPTLELKSRTAH
jgi:ABC-2 type transport system permease protein